MAHWLVLPANQASLGNSLVAMVQRHMPALVRNVRPEFQNDSAAVLDVAPAKLGSETVTLDVNLQLNSGVGLVAWRDGLHSELTCVARGRLTSGALRFQVAFEVPQPSSSPCAQTPP